MDLRKVRILHVVPSLSRSAGGTTHAVQNIVHIERLLGITPEILTVESSAMDGDIPKCVTVHTFRPSFPKRFTRSAQATEWSLSHVSDYDLASFHGVWSPLLQRIARISNDCGIPYVIRPHGSLDPFDLRKKGAAKDILGPLFVKDYLQNSASVLCTAIREKEVLETYTARPRIEVLPLPIPPANSKGNRERFRLRWGLHKDDFVLLFLSRVDYKKGLDTLLHSMQTLHSRYRNLRLAIAGSGSAAYERYIRRLSIQLGLEVSVKFIGFLTGPDKTDAFWGSDCFVLPSLNENFGIAIVEALQSGLPVLISKNVYIWREIVEGGGGWTCECSPGSIAEAIERDVIPQSAILKDNQGPYKAAGRFLPETLLERYRLAYESFLE